VHAVAVTEELVSRGDADERPLAVRRDRIRRRVRTAPKRGTAKARGNLGTFIIDVCDVFLRLRRFSRLGDPRGEDRVDSCPRAVPSVSETFSKTPRRSTRKALILVTKCCGPVDFVHIAGRSVPSLSRCPATRPRRVPRVDASSLGSVSLERIKESFVFERTS
jgi:hypothetical protein